MPKNKIPKYNDSLRAFSSFITTSLVIGILCLMIAFFNSFGNTPIALLFVYISSLALGLAVVAVFLRQTAKIIVEGLGGSVRISNQSQGGQGIYDLDPSLDEIELAGKLWPKDFEKWKNAGMPSLKEFAKSGNRSLHDWLKQQ
jgi:hypothetical protein